MLQESHLTVDGGRGHCVLSLHTLRPDLLHVARSDLVQRAAREACLPRFTIASILPPCPLVALSGLDVLVDHVGQEPTRGLRPTLRAGALNPPCLALPLRQRLPACLSPPPMPIRAGPTYPPTAAPTRSTGP